MDYPQLLAQDRRLSILRLLNDSGGGLNDSIAQSALDTLGLPSAREDIRDDFEWLAKAKLVVHEAVSPTLATVKITQRGVDVALGRARVEGVKRPSPEV